MKNNCLLVSNNFLKNITLFFIFTFFIAILANILELFSIKRYYKILKTKKIFLNKNNEIKDIIPERFDEFIETQSRSCLMHFDTIKKKIINLACYSPLILFTYAFFNHEIGFRKDYYFVIFILIAFLFGIFAESRIYKGDTIKIIIKYMFEEIAPFIFIAALFKSALFYGGLWIFIFVKTLKQTIADQKQQCRYLSTIGNEFDLSILRPDILDLVKKYGYQNNIRVVENNPVSNAFCSNLYGFKNLLLFFKQKVRDSELLNFFIVHELGHINDRSVSFSPILEFIPIIGNSLFIIFIIYTLNSKVHSIKSFLISIPLTYGLVYSFIVGGFWVLKMFVNFIRRYFEYSADDFVKIIEDGNLISAKALCTMMIENDNVLLYHSFLYNFIFLDHPTHFDRINRFLSEL